MIGEAWGMLSTPIFEQLCRELVGSGEPEEAYAEASETGANNQKPATCPEPRSETDSEAEPQSDTGSDAESDADPEPEAEPEPESVDEPEPEVGWTAPEERVA